MVVAGSLPSGRHLLPRRDYGRLPAIRPRPGRELFRSTYGHSFGHAQSRVVFVAGQPKLDYKFAPKANRRPSQSRASLKNPRKTEVYEARKIDYGEKFGGLRASVEFLAGNSHSKPRLLD